MSEARAGQSTEMLFSDEFRCEGHFDYRTIVDVVPERMGNWAVKMTGLPDGRLMMIWCSTSEGEGSPTNRIWVSFSPDEGATWDAPELLAAADEQGWPLNPCCHTHTDGTVLAFYNVYRGRRGPVCYQTSNDCGKTWSGRRVMATGETFLSVMSNPIRLRDGTILLPLCFDRPRDGREHFVGLVMLSDDGGGSWRRGGEFDVDAERGAMEPSIAELGNGDLYCLLRTRTGYQYQCWSSDGGKSWTRPDRSPFASPAATGILRRLAGGDLVFVWNNNRISGGAQIPRYPLFAALSRDDGKTWPHQKMIETACGKQQLSNHGVFQAESGAILVATNHFQGKWDGVEHGPIELARFDVAWLCSHVSADKWEERPAPTGGVRLDEEGVLLVAGASHGDRTSLASRFALPRRCVVEHVASGPPTGPIPCAGLFVGPTELAPPGPLDSTSVRLRFQDGRVRYEDCAGPAGDWRALPEDVTWPAPWGFFSRNMGTQERLKVSSISVSVR